MNNIPADILPSRQRAWGWLGLRLLLVAVCCTLVGWGVWRETLTRQLDQLGQQAHQHAEFYRLSLESLLTRNASLPRVITLEDRLKKLLEAPLDARARSEANAYLLKVKKGADISETFLMDKGGLTLAASNYQLPESFVGASYAYRPYFRDAMQKGLGIFYGIGATTGYPGYFLTAPIEDKGKKIGAATVKISLEDFEAAMIRSGDKIFLADAEGVIFLASVAQWKYRSLTPLEPEVLARIADSRQYRDQRISPLGIALPVQDKPQLIRLALPDGAPQDYLVQSVGTGPLGWSIVLLTPTRQERQNALLAGGAAGLAAAFSLLVVIFFRLHIRRYNERRQAAVALRQAHGDLERRIAERTADLRATNASLEEKIETLKTTENILRETRDGAVQAGKLAVLGQMAAGISHEVNQPLTALHTFTENAMHLLERGELDEVRENLGLIRQMAERMGHLVGEIKRFARKPPQERQSVRVADVVDQVLMLVEARRRSVGARIDVSGVAGELRVRADPQRLEQVLVNLLLNALDAVAAADERNIAVSACAAESGVDIIVRDSGPGIAETALPHMFEPFFTTKPAGSGLGLGLAISRMIATELGGDLQVWNRDGGGAEFIVRLERV